MRQSTSAVSSVFGPSQNKIIRQFVVTYIDWRDTRESLENCESFSIIIKNCVVYQYIEDSYAAGYSGNFSRIYIFARQLESLLEPSPDAPISWRGPEGALCIDTEITPLVSILGGLDNGYIEIYMALQEE